VSVDEMAEERPASSLWFSALLRLVYFVNDAQQEELLQDDLVHVFRASDRDSAFLPALELGRAHETEYVNHERAIVQWRFERVVKLQRISAESIDGAEVSSSLSRTDYRPFDTEFQAWAHLPDDDFI
jgi:Domain of unknown function (DUF4288)